MSGYRRYRVTDAGAGACTLWTAVLDTFRAENDASTPREVGTVLQVYDRSAYVEFSETAVDAGVTTGPPLVLLAGPSFTGPLATCLDSDTAVSFPADAFEAGETCTLRPATQVGGESDALVFSIGSTLDVDVDPAVFRRPEDRQERYADLEAIEMDGPVWRQAETLLRWLDRSEFDDGLGWTPDLVRAASGDGGEQFRTLSEAWVEWLAGGPDELPASSGLDMLGRGPGATPSGDDFLSGILLALLRTTAGPTNERSREAGAQLVDAAAERTTKISTALLAQAAQGRTSETMEAGLRTLLVPSTTEVPSDEIVSMMELGHTSGRDTLLGMLFVVLLVAPELEKCSNN